MGRRRRRFRPGRRPRRGKRPTSFGEIVGLPFYDAEGWDALRESVADPESLATSHGEWLSKFRRTEADMKRIGVLVKPVSVDATALAQWCDEQGLANTKDLRARYAAELFREAQRRAAAEELEADGHT